MEQAGKMQLLKPCSALAGSGWSCQNYFRLLHAEDSTRTATRGIVQYDFACGRSGNHGLCSFVVDVEYQPLICRHHWLSKTSISRDEDDKHTGLAILSGSQDTPSTYGLLPFCDGFRSLLQSDMGLPHLLAMFRRELLTQFNLPHFFVGFGSAFIVFWFT